VESDDEQSRSLQEKILHSERERRYLRKDSDDRKVMEEVFDQATLLALKELISQKEILQLNGVVRAGKEARVYWGVGPDNRPRAVKIYLMVSADFKKRLVYIAGDKRFQRLPSNSHEVIKLWVRKEFKNLQQADSAGIRVPKPYSFFRNVIIMEYIGDPPLPAPLLAEAEVDESDYAWVFRTISRLYKKAGLVHADLSEFNIFKWGKERIIFDFGSAVLPSHPEAIEFLRRDVTNMVRFFKKRGIFKKEPETLMGEITK
jgi:RIO kinase 1